MVTEGMIFAIDTLVSMCSDDNQRAGMNSVREMLCDFDHDQWDDMSDEERSEWLATFLSCKAKEI